MAIARNKGESENSFSSLLSRELWLLGIEHIPFQHIDTPEGHHEVDIMCSHNGLDYPCEAKMSENDIYDAIAKINNKYLNYSTIMGFGGGFAILHPKGVSFQDVEKKLLAAKFKVLSMWCPDDKRDMCHFEGSIKEVAKFIADSILKTPIPTIPDINFIINALRKGADVITEGLNELRDNKLPYIFGSQNIFENVLEYGELKVTKKDDIQDLRIVSAYLLINQLLFYQIISSKISRLKPIDAKKLYEPKDLKPYFDKVLDINYRVVYGYDVASWIPIKFTEEIKKIVFGIQQLGPEKISGDLLGTIFHNLIPFELRKRIAAFYTNPLAAEILASLIIETPYDKVSDYSCGSGTLLGASYDQKERLGGQINQYTHMRMLEEEIFGSDIMPFAASIAASHLAIKHPEYPTEHVNIAIKDSITLQPNVVISSVIDTVADNRGQSKISDLFGSSNSFSSSVVKNTENSRDFVFPMSDATIMNPPFTRQEKLSEKYKKSLLENLIEYKEYINGQMSLCGHFIFIADKFLKDHGRLGFVIPGTVLRLQSFGGVRKLLREKYYVRHIISIIGKRSAFSESTSLREIMLVASKEKPKEDDKVFVSFIKQMPQTSKEAQALVSVIKAKKEIDNDIIKMIAYPVADLYDNDNWYRFMSIVDTDLMEFSDELSNNEKLVPITNFITPHTNTLSYYSSQEFHGFLQKGMMKGRVDQWKVIEEKDTYITVQNITFKSIIKIEKSLLYRAFRRPAQLKRMNVTDDADYLIVEYFDDIKKLAFPVVGNKANDITKSDIAKWKSKANTNASRMSYTYKVDITAPGTSHVAFYSDEPIVGLNIKSLKTKVSTSDEPALTSNEEKVVVMWLNSTFGILNLLRERIETRGGFFSIDGYVFDDMLVPDVKQLTESDKDEVAKLLDKIGNIEMPSVREQLAMQHSIRREIDELWMRILDIDIDLNWLYRKTLSEIEILKSIMGK